MQDSANVAAERIELNYAVTVPSRPKVLRHLASPEQGPKIVLLSGGSGASALSRALTRYTRNSVHIVTVFDNGGSSRLLRRAFGMEAPGDLRHRMLDLTVASRPDTREAVQLLRTRMSRLMSNDRLQGELEALVAGSHPLIQSVDPTLAAILRVYLGTFAREKPDDFDLSGGSLGNFVLAGSFLLYNRDIQSAVRVVSSLAGVQGTVVPVAKGNYHLAAELAGGARVIGQSSITTGAGRVRAPIQRLFLVRGEAQDAAEVQVAANPLALQCVREADLIVYSIGSFYTSIIANLLVEGMGAALRSARVPKVLIANAIEDLETEGLAASDLAAKIIHYASQSDREGGQPTDYLNVVLANHHGASRVYRGRAGYIPVDKAGIQSLGVSVLEFPLELPAEAGHYDPELLAQVLVSLSNA